MVDLYQGIGGETGDGFYIFCFFLYEFLSVALLSPLFSFVVTGA